MPILSFFFFFFLQGMYFWYETKLVSYDGYKILTIYLRNTLMR